MQKHSDILFCVIHAKKIVQFNNTENCYFAFFVYDLFDEIFDLVILKCRPKYRFKFNNKYLSALYYTFSKLFSFRSIWFSKCPLISLVTLSCYCYRFLLNKLFSLPIFDASSKKDLSYSNNTLYCTYFLAF